MSDGAGGASPELAPSGPGEEGGNGEEEEEEEGGALSPPYPTPSPSPSPAPPPGVVEALQKQVEALGAENSRLQQMLEQRQNVVTGAELLQQGGHIAREQIEEEEASPEPEYEPQQELQPEPEYENQEYESPPPPLRDAERGKRMPLYHKHVLAGCLATFGARNTMREALQRWVNHVALAQRRWELLGAKARGSSAVAWGTRLRLMWGSYHRWRLWLGMRRSHPKAFGLVPRALIYDPAEPEIGDVETIKERIQYHNGEIAELTNVVRRHGEIVELLRAALQRKLTEEMQRLQAITVQIERERAVWGDPNTSVVASPSAASPVVSHPQPGLTLALPPPAHEPSPPLPPRTPAPVIVPVLTELASPEHQDEHFHSNQHHQLLPHMQQQQHQPPFTVPLPGYISQGGDLFGGPKWLHLHEATALATAEAACLGFTYNTKNETADGRYLVYFKSKGDVYAHAKNWKSCTRSNGNDGGLRGARGRQQQQQHDTASEPQEPVGELEMLPPAHPVPTHPPPPRQEQQQQNPRRGHQDPSRVITGLGLSPAFRRRLINFYQHYNPSKLPSVMHTLQEFTGHEEALFEALAEQYGPDPPEAANPLPPGWHLTESSRGDLFYKHSSGKKQWQFPEM